MRHRGLPSIVKWALVLNAICLSIALGGCEGDPCYEERYAELIKKGVPHQAAALQAESECSAPIYEDFSAGSDYPNYTVDTLSTVYLPAASPTPGPVTEYDSIIQTSTFYPDGVTIVICVVIGGEDEQDSVAFYAESDDILYLNAERITHYGDGIPYSGQPPMTVLEMADLDGSGWYFAVVEPDETGGTMDWWVELVTQPDTTTIVSTLFATLYQEGGEQHVIDVVSPHPEWEVTSLVGGTLETCHDLVAN